jgi:hypothetical protein
VDGKRGGRIAPGVKGGHAMAAVAPVPGGGHRHAVICGVSGTLNARCRGTPDGADGGRLEREKQAEGRRGEGAADRQTSEERK